MSSDLGVLIVCFGNKVKDSLFLSLLEKRYVVRILVGVKSSTLDVTGKVYFFDTIDVNVKKYDLRCILRSLIKCAYQKPPLYSSIKHHKIPLYKYARLDIDVNIKRKKIIMHKIGLNIIKHNQIVLDITCSKGTYIRSVVEYLEEKLLIPMSVIQITRLSVGNFNILQSYSLSDILRFKSISEIEQVIL